MFTSMCLAVTLVGGHGCPTGFYSGYYGSPGYGYQSYYSPGMYSGYGYPGYGSWTYSSPTYGYQSYGSQTRGYGYAAPGARQAYGQPQFRGGASGGYGTRGDQHGGQQRRGYGQRGQAEPGPPPAPGAEPREGRQANVVQMTDQMRFQPSRITVREGTTVEWRNTSRAPHTVTADPRKAQDPKSVALPEGAKPFDSGRIPPGERFEHTFKVPGTYRYVCIPHETRGMIGEVVVQSRGEGAAPPDAEETGRPRAGEARPETDEKLPPTPPGDAADDERRPAAPKGEAEKESPEPPAEESEEPEAGEEPEA